MSSISLPYEKQIRHFFPFSGIATETTVATFISGASNGEIQLFKAQGTTTSPGPDFYILKKDLTGKVVKSDLITPKDITYLRGSAPVTKVGKTNVLTITSVVVGAVYNINLKIHYGNSEQNFEFIFASTTAVTGDTPTTVMTRLSKQLGDNLAASMYTSTTISGTDTIISGTTTLKNKYFTLTQVAGALTISEKNWILDGYYTGLKSFDQLMWNAEIQSSNEAAFAATTKTATTPVYAARQGYQMLELERYLVGHRAEFDGPDVTLGFHRQYEINPASAYFCLDLKYFDIPRDDPHRSDKMLTLASTSAIDVDAIGYRIEALMGAAEGTVWNELDPAQNGSDNV